LPLRATPKTRWLTRRKSKVAPFYWVLPVLVKLISRICMFFLGGVLGAPLSRQSLWKKAKATTPYRTHLATQMPEVTIQSNGLYPF